MCDTWIALKDATREGRVIFAKNSDRPVFDCQPLLFQPAGSGRPAAGSKQNTSNCHRLELPMLTWGQAHIGAGDMRRASTNGAL